MKENTGQNDRRISLQNELKGISKETEENMVWLSEKLQGVIRAFSTDKLQRLITDVCKSLKSLEKRENCKLSYA